MNSTRTRSRFRRLAIPLVVLAAAGAPAGTPDALSWERLKAAYAYERDPPPRFDEQPREDAEFPLTRLEFANRDGRKAPCLLMRPKGDGPFPCVLLLHGLTGSKDGVIRQFGRRLARRGLAAFAVDALQHGERRLKAENERPVIGSFAQIMQTTVVDYRQALDALKDRKELDPERTGLLGYSMGAMMGAILAGVDERVRAAVLCVGGDLTRALRDRSPAGRRGGADVTSPANYIGRISPRPILMINGRNDRVVPENAARALFEAARPPREIIWVDAGHALPLEATDRGLDWLAERLKTR